MSEKSDPPPDNDWSETYQPKTELGRILIECRKRIIASGQRLLSMDEIDELLDRDRYERYKGEAAGSSSAMVRGGVINLARDIDAACSNLIAIRDESDEFTYSKLWLRVDRLSQGLLALGLKKGDAILAWLPNCHQAIETELAVLQCGFAWVTLNSRMTWLEVAGVIAACGPKVMITDRAGIDRIDPNFAGLPPILLTGEAAPHLSQQPKNSSPNVAQPPSAVHLGEQDLSTTAEGGCATFGGSDLKDSVESFEELIARSPSVRPEIEINENDIARLRYTSGTTGTAKAAVLPHRVYLASLENLQNELHPLTPADRALHIAPITHASGGLIYPILAAGGANVLLPHFDAELALETIERERITTMFVVPTILHRLTLSPSFKTRDLSSLKTVFYGGAPMATEQLLPALDRIGHALVHIFGMSEAPWPITTLRHTEHGRGSPKLGSIGKPTKICEIQIRDDAGHELPDGETGELWIRGRNVMSGYWRDEEATKQVLRDGWLASGDLGYRDADGYLWIVDRKKDVIISGGFNVYAKEVELALCEHPAVAEAAVIGLPHGEWGEMVAAYLVPRPGASIDPNQISEWCRARLSNYKCPKRIEILSELPKNASGKILKRGLKERMKDEG